MEFSKEQALEVIDDFMVSFPSLQRKTLAVLLMQMFRVKQKMTAVDVAQEAASICSLKALFSDTLTNSLITKVNFLNPSGESTLGRAFSMMKTFALRLQCKCAKTHKKR